MSTSGKYHISKSTGNPNKCEATKRGCPLGGDAPHFDSKAEAFAYIEKTAAEEHSLMPAVAKKERDMTRKEATERVTERRRLQEELRLTEHKIGKLHARAGRSYADDKELFAEAADLFKAKADAQRKFIEDLPAMSPMEATVNHEIDLKQDIAVLKTRETVLKTALRSSRGNPFRRDTAKQEATLAEVQAELKAKREELRGPDKPKAAALTSSAYPVNKAAKLENVTYEATDQAGKVKQYKRLTLGDVPVTVKSYRDRSDTKPRVYVAMGSPEELEAKTGLKSSELEYTIKGENPEMDAKWKKWNKAQVEIGRANALKTLADAGFEGVGVKWSRTAGCGCGCSPGFIADRDLPTAGGNTIKDLHGSNAWGSGKTGAPKVVSREEYHR